MKPLKKQPERRITAKGLRSAIGWLDFASLVVGVDQFIKMIYIFVTAMNNEEEFMQFFPKLCSCVVILLISCALGIFFEKLAAGVAEILENIEVIRSSKQRNREKVIEQTEEELKQIKEQTEDKQKYIPTEEDKVYGEWQKLRQRSITDRGRCENCGKPWQEIVFYEFEDQFGKAERFVCYDCFEKKYKP